MLDVGKNDKKIKKLMNYWVNNTIKEKIVIINTENISKNNIKVSNNNLSNK